jgi:hypothetical protein
LPEQSRIPRTLDARDQLAKHPYFIVPGLAGVVEPVLDGDDVDEEPEVPPMVDDEPNAPPEVDESEPVPDVLLPAPDVPEVPRLEDDDPGRVDVVPGIELDDPGVVLEVDEPGVLDVSEPDVPDAPDDPDMPLLEDPGIPLPEDPDMPLPEDPDIPLPDEPLMLPPVVLDGVSLLVEPPLVEAPDDGLADVPPIVELLPAPVDCAMATPADSDKRTAIVVSFFIFHSSMCLSTFHLRAWTLDAVENCQSEDGLASFDSCRQGPPICFMGAS